VDAFVLSQGSGFGKFSPISTRTFYASIINAISAVNRPVDRNRPGILQCIPDRHDRAHIPQVNSDIRISFSMLPELIGRWYRHSLSSLFSFISLVISSSL
jgi:hypothetical protein